MRNYNKSIILSIVIIIFLSMIGSDILNAHVINQNVTRQNPIKVAAVIYDITAPYPAEVIDSLKTIEENNKDKIQFTFFNSNNDKSQENELLNSILSNNEYSLILVDLVDINAVQSVVNKIKSTNIPMIIFHREPYTMDAIKSYNKAIFIGSNPVEAGILQGKVLVNEWVKRKEIIDHDKDNTMEYILLKGKINSLDTINRSNFSISTILNEGIDAVELASRVCNWDEEEGRKATEALLVQFGDKIEVVNSNNDSMAIGAIKALQAVGFNTGYNSKTIPVVGVDGIQEAKDLIDKGIMTNTIIQDADSTADAIFLCGMNLVQKKNPLEGTNYTFDDSGVAIRISYKLYKPLTD